MPLTDKYICVSELREKFGAGKPRGPWLFATWFRNCNTTSSGSATGLHIKRWQRNTATRVRRFALLDVLLVTCCHLIFVHNLHRCWPTFNIPLLLDSAINLQHLWNQLPSLFCQPYPVHPPPISPHPACITSSQFPSLLPRSVNSPAMRQSHLSANDLDKVWVKKYPPSCGLWLRRTNFESLALALKVKSFALSKSPCSRATDGRLSTVYQQADRCHWKLSVHCHPDEVLRQATWTVQSTAVHACIIGPSREGVLSEWTTVETAQGTDVRHSAGNFGVSEVHVPLDLTQVNCQFSRATQSHTNYDMKAVKAPCDCQLDSFEPLILFNKVFIAWTCATVELTTFT